MVNFQFAEFLNSLPERPSVTDDELVSRLNGFESYKGKSLPKEYFDKVVEAYIETNHGDGYAIAMWLTKNASVDISRAEMEELDYLNTVFKRLAAAKVQDWVNKHGINNNLPFKVGSVVRFMWGEKEMVGVVADIYKHTAMVVIKPACVFLFNDKANAMPIVRYENLVEVVAL